MGLHFVCNDANHVVKYIFMLLSWAGKHILFSNYWGTAGTMVQELSSRTARYKLKWKAAVAKVLAANIDTTGPPMLDGAHPCTN